jgi:hypothetical protein
LFPQCRCGKNVQFQIGFFEFLKQHSLHFKIKEILVVDEEQPEFFRTFCNDLSKLCTNEPFNFQQSAMNLSFPEESQLKNSPEYKLFWQEKFKLKKDKFPNKDEFERIIYYDEKAYQRLVFDITQYYEGTLN